MELINKEVNFEEYCQKCAYKAIDQGDDPCNECLAHPSNQNSVVPVMFKAASKTRQTSSTGGGSSTTHECTIQIIKVNGQTQKIVNHTVDITVPTKTSELENDARFAKKRDIPTAVSELENDSGFITLKDLPESQKVPTKTSELENDSGFITDSALEGYAKTDDLTEYAKKSDIPDPVMVPKDVSAFNNDAGYITKEDIPEVDVPTAVSELENDSGFITSEAIPTQVSSYENDAGYITDAALEPYAKKTEMPEVPVYSLNKMETAEDGYFASYKMTKDGSAIGDTINIPKDYLVKSAEIKTAGTDDPSGYEEGIKYIDFVVNVKSGNSDESHIYLNVNELVDAYTAGENVSISEANEISVDLSGKMDASNPVGTGSFSLNGNAWFAGDVYTGSTSGQYKDDGSKKLLTEDDVKTLNTPTVLRNPESITLRSGQQIVMYASNSLDVTLNAYDIEYTVTIPDSDTAYWALWVKSDVKSGSFVHPNGTRYYVHTNEVEDIGDEITFTVTKSNTNRSLIIIII